MSHIVLKGLFFPCWEVRRLKRSLKRAGRRKRRSQSVLKAMARPIRTRWATSSSPLMLGSSLSDQSNENSTLCPAVSFRLTGVAPAQAPGVGAISQQPRSQFPAGAVAIKPANFGVALSGSPSDPTSVRGVLGAIRLLPDWSTADRPGGVSAVPRGIPAYTNYIPVDVIGPATVRNAPGNHID
jgi:hypothetical protein